jgi:hypothetical protein
VKNRRIATMQDMRALVLDTLGQFAREHDTEGIAEHLLQISQHDGASYYGRILDQGDEDLVHVDDFWALARRYHHTTVQRRDPSHAGPYYAAPKPPPKRKPRHVSPKRQTPTPAPRTRA